MTTFLDEAVTMPRLDANQVSLNLYTTGTVPAASSVPSRSLAMVNTFLCYSDTVNWRRVDGDNIEV